MSTVLRYLKLQLQSVACLGIGPFFLVIYFAADNPQPAWMLWWGLGLTVLSVFLALRATKIGANTMFSRRDPEGDFDQTVGDSDSFAGRLRGEEPPNPYEGFLPPDPRK